MNRLTTRNSDGAWGVPIRNDDDGAYIPSQEIIDRLAAYEDTGLEPEQCAKYAQAEKEGRYIVLKEPRSAGVHRLEELARADIEGRVLVPPCKVGDRVWLIVQGMSSPMPVPVCSLTWRDGKWSINADREETEPPKVVGFQIGKTAFLTREEAEKALEGMK